MDSLTPDSVCSPKPSGLDLDGGLPRILAVAGDPGGAAALAPVLAAFQNGGRVRVYARAYRQAREVWRGWSIGYEALDETSSLESIGELIGELQPSLLLCGSSVNGVDLEKLFVHAARRREVPSFGLLDFWSNYTARFSDPQGRLVFLPDLLGVMDWQAREQMIAEGFPAGRLCVTGQPAFDRLGALRREFSAARRTKVRESVGASAHDCVVVFVSQPLAAMYGHNSVCARNHPGYDERQVRQLVVSALEALSAETAGKIHLVVRPHPREHVEEFFCLNSARIRVRLARDERVHELVLSADLVVGMSSALLVEACYLGCITLSVQPGLQTADVLPTNASGLSRAVYRAEGVLPAIREMMLNPTVRQAMQARLATFQPDGRATERVLGQAFEMFGQPSARIRS